MRKILSLLIILSTTLSLCGQQAQISSSLDTNAILIGEQAHLKLQLSLPLGQQLVFPKLKDTLSAQIPIVRISPIDSVIDQAQQRLQLSQTLSITAFDTGYWRIPPITALIQSAEGNTWDTISSHSTLLNVFTVAVDTTQDIKPIINPMSQGYTLQEIFPWVLLAIGIITVLLIAWFYWQKKRHKQPLFGKAAKPLLPPHEEALEALGELRHQKLWQQGLLKGYYTQLTDIVRHYIDRRFGINAMEMTSDEIIEQLQDTTTNQEVLQKLTSTLSIADMIKFAKGNATAIENDGCWHNCVDFVNETKAVKPTAETDGKEATDV